MRAVQLPFGLGPRRHSRDRLVLFRIGKEMWGFLSNASYCVCAARREGTISRHAAVRLRGIALSGGQIINLFDHYLLGPFQGDRLRDNGQGGEAGD